MFKYSGGHAQVFFGAALLTDITAYTEDAFKGIVLIPHQNQTQLDRNFSAVRAQAVKQEQLGFDLCAQR